MLKLLLLSLVHTSLQQAGVKTFTAEVFIDLSALDSGLYEGSVRGRPRFGGTQRPHGTGTIFYFTNDQYNRQNYTGQWENGSREGTGTTHFKDGTFYTGNYHKSLEEGTGKISYPNGNVLEAEFKGGQAEGHGVTRYSNGDQREGFFTNNVLDGQVIFTRNDGATVIEKWSKGERLEDKDELVKDAANLTNSSSGLKSASSGDGSSGLTQNSSGLKQNSSGEKLNVQQVLKSIRDRSGGKFSITNTEREAKKAGSAVFSSVGERSRNGQSIFLRQIFDLVNSRKR